MRVSLFVCLALAYSNSFCFCFCVFCFWKPLIFFFMLFLGNLHSVSFTVLGFFFFCVSVFISIDSIYICGINYLLPKTVQLKRKYWERLNSNADRIAHRLFRDTSITNGYWSVDCTAPIVAFIARTYGILIALCWSFSAYISFVFLHLCVCFFPFVRYMKCMWSSIQYILAYDASKCWRKQEDKCCIWGIQTCMGIFDRVWFSMSQSQGSHRILSIIAIKFFLAIESIFISIASNVIKYSEAKRSISVQKTAYKIGSFICWLAVVLCLLLLLLLLFLFFVQCAERYVVCSIQCICMPAATVIPYTYNEKGKIKENELFCNFQTRKTREKGSEIKQPTKFYTQRIQ